LKTVQEVLHNALQIVQKQRPDHEVQEWIAWNLKIRRLDLFLFPNSFISPKQLASIDSGCQRLAKGEPLAYITNEAHFYGFSLYVTQDVLIPRPETEILVETASRFLSHQHPSILFDVCTGSGCIGLTLKKLFPSWRVILSDISHAALEVAKENARRLDVDVEFIQGDLLDCFSGKALCIVCNPPYISTHEMQTLDSSVTRYEPNLALCAGDRGTENYEHILRALPSHLLPQGICFFEIGSSQASTVMDLSKNAGFTPLLHLDLEGRPRVVAVQREISIFD
jgi:release factor glutamine methyltransferase